MTSHSVWQGNFPMTQSCQAYVVVLRLEASEQFNWRTEPHTLNLILDWACPATQKSNTCVLPLHLSFAQELVIS